MENECAICLEGLITKNEFDEQLKVAAMTGCGHLYHEDCLIASFAQLKTANNAAGPLDPATISYKEHPKCPKCRSRPQGCKDRKCIPVYGYYGDIAYRCYPFTRIFIEDDGRGLLKQEKDDKDVKYLEVKLSNNSVQKFGYAKAARDLGLDLEAVLEAAEEVLGTGGPKANRLPKKSRDKVETIQKKLEAMMKEMKDKQTDGVLQTYIEDLRTMSRRLHDTLDLAGQCEDYRAELEALHLAKEAYAEGRVAAAEAPLQATIAQLQRDKELFNLRLVEGRESVEKARSEVKKRDKQIKEVTQLKKKIKGLESTMEKEKFRSAHEVKNITGKLEKAETTVSEQKAKLAELKSKLKDSEKRAKDMEAAMKKLQPKVAAGPKAKDIIDLSSSMPPSTPPRKKTKLDRGTSPASAIDSDLTEVAETPDNTPKPRTTRQGVSLSKQESADFTKLIAQSSRQKKEERDAQLKDSAMQKTWGWLATASQASSSAATSTVVDTPPRATRSTTKRKREELEREAA